VIVKMGVASFVSAVALRSLEYLLGRKPYRAECVLHWIAARHYPHFPTFQYVSHIMLTGTYLCSFMLAGTHLHLFMLKY